MKFAKYKQEVLDITFLDTAAALAAELGRILQGAVFGAGVISDTEEEGAWQCRDGSQAHRDEGAWQCSVEMDHRLPGY